MAEASRLTDGTLLQSGKYQIIRFLGAGSFSCTYEANSGELNKYVVIKEFFPSSLCSRDAAGLVSASMEGNAATVDKLRKQFVDEANKLSQHKDTEGIVKVIDVFEENGTAYYAMDYIDGRTVQKVLDKKGPFSEADALKMIQAIGNALKAVHASGCLHLDIKPENIMVDSDGHPILINFGASKQCGENGAIASSLITYTGGYAPLELTKGDVHTFTPATDVYALGATLYSMLTGMTPPDAIDLLSDSATLQFPPEVSMTTRKAIEAAMDPRMKKRPATVADFLAMLPGSPAKTLIVKPDQATTVYVTHKRHQAKPRKSNSKKYVWLIAFVLLAAISAFVFWPMDSNPAPQPEDATDTLAKHSAIALADTISDPRDMEDTAEADSAIEAEAAPAPTTAKSKISKASGAAKIVEEPVKTTKTEPVMIAAYTSDKKYKAYTIDEWNALSSAQKAAVQPIGVQVIASGMKFIVAPTDAANAVKWEDPATVTPDNEDIPGLKNLAWTDDKAAAKGDYNGYSNTSTILAYGKNQGITYPAARAAANYTVKGKGGWYLPACGQLLLIYDNKPAIEIALSKIGGKEIGSSWYWSSTEEDPSYAWYVNMDNGSLYNYKKQNPSNVRPIAPVPGK